MSHKIPSFIAFLLFCSCSPPRQVSVPQPPPEVRAPEPPKAEPPKPQKTVLVLSVGGVRGLAHIGAIDAMKGKSIRPDAVFGNSMGAVIGALYVTAPSADLAARYRELIAAYEKRIAQETPIYRKIGIWLRLTDVEFDNKQFENVLRDFCSAAKIEALPMNFATSYKVRDGDSIKDVGRVSGDLAEAVARSANNPFIFKNTEFKYIDPGIDRISAVPVEDAFRIFKPDRIIAVNVTGDPVFYSRAVTATVIEVNLNIPAFKPQDELAGTGRNFEWLYKVGFDELTAALAQSQGTTENRHR
jgi:predicted acylesterase/phospholipase RssA